eukprot:CAMPEP_0177681922 /NCGR_PEP_ID=MMETSP0447-20121125/30984_1 /TAXON_ID=0 /ORGANISM="Stygamoeba regulata, Strain BSH-02190019" /LENGTH=171 /DNA_ID=CAMNT_0019191391 /DNA_START=124 /DNA_END=637 /DNA_ORIENTATION=+
MDLLHLFLQNLVDPPLAVQQPFPIKFITYDEEDELQATPTAGLVTHTEDIIVISRQDFCTQLFFQGFQNISHVFLTLTCTSAVRSTARACDHDFLTIGWGGARWDHQRGRHDGGQRDLGRADQGSGRPAFEERNAAAFAGLQAYQKAASTAEVWPPTPAQEARALRLGHLC